MVEIFRTKPSKVEILLLAYEAAYLISLAYDWNNTRRQWLLFQ